MSLLARAREISKPTIFILIVGLIMGVSIGYFATPPKVVKIRWANVTKTNFQIVKGFPNKFRDVKILEKDELIIFIWFDDTFDRYKISIMEVK